MFDDKLVVLFDAKLVDGKLVVCSVAAAAGVALKLMRRMVKDADVAAGMMALMLEIILSYIEPLASGALTICKESTPRPSL